MLVEVGNETVHLVEVHSRICICEVTTEWDEHVLARVILGHFIDILLHHHCFVECVEGVQSFVGNKRVVVRESLIIPEALWPAVMVPHDTGENLLLVSKVLRERPPKEIH
jgi:hypothetical protein